MVLLGMQHLARGAQHVDGVRAALQRVGAHEAVVVADHELVAAVEICHTARASDGGISAGTAWVGGTNVSDEDGAAVARDLERARRRQERHGVARRRDDVAEALGVHGHEHVLREPPSARPPRTNVADPYLSDVEHVAHGQASDLHSERASQQRRRVLGGAGVRRTVPRPRQHRYGRACCSLKTARSPPRLPIINSLVCVPHARERRQ